jgi:hypothetical protein
MSTSWNDTKKIGSEELLANNKRQGGDCRPTWVSVLLFGDLLRRRPAACLLRPVNIFFGPQDQHESDAAIFFFANLRSESASLLLL